MAHCDFNESCNTYSSQYCVCSDCAQLTQLGNCRKGMLALLTYCDRSGQFFFNRLEFILSNINSFLYRHACSSFKEYELKLSTFDFSFTW